mgnify:CR=1 FL=1
MQPPHLAHWPSHLPQSITVPATALPDNLETSARRYPDKAALVFFGRAMPYRELAHTAERLAAYLHSVGVRQGDRVILLMQNLPQLVAAHFAILRANAVVVPVNPMNLAEELKHYITDGEVKVAIASADLSAELAKASNALPPGQRLDHRPVARRPLHGQHRVLRGDGSRGPAGRLQDREKHRLPRRRGRPEHRHDVPAGPLLSGG